MALQERDIWSTKEKSSLYQQVASSFFEMPILKRVEMLNRLPEGVPQSAVNYLAILNRKQFPWSKITVD